MSKKKNKCINRILFFVFLISIVCVLAIKSSLFNVDSIMVQNNLSIESEKIIELSNVVIGTNIFSIKINEVKENILSNNEISNVKVTKKLPNRIIIEIKERSNVFYINNNGAYYLIDSKGFVFEKKANIQDNNLIEITGLNYEMLKKGEGLEVLDSRKIDIIASLTELFRNLVSDVDKPSLVDIADLTDIKIYYDKMCIMIGNANDLKSKLNRGINILYGKELINKAGYIDVSFDGDPVFYIDN